MILDFRLNGHPTSLLKGQIRLAETLESGQAFRWQRVGDEFRGVIGRRVVWLRQMNGGVEWKCAPPTDDGVFLSHYLGLDGPLERIVASFPDDPHLCEAVRRYYG